MVRSVVKQTFCDMTNFTEFDSPLPFFVIIRVVDIGFSDEPYPVDHQLRGATLRKVRYVGNDCPSTSREIGVLATHLSAR